jgi:hypothetical protein
LNEEVSEVNKYIVPEMDIKVFEVENILTASSAKTSKLSNIGSQAEGTSHTETASYSELFDD